MTKLNQLHLGPPDKEELIKRIKDNVPNDLFGKEIWIAYYYKQNKDGTYTKPPCTQQGHTVDENRPGVTFEEAIKDGYPGIKINKHTNLIAFDIDDKEAKLGNRVFDMSRMSDEFKKFLAEYDSYIEMSPSQCGLRILMTCEDKSILPGRSNLSKEKCIGGELFMNSGYVTITGDQIAGTGIAEIDPHKLKQWIGVKDKAEVIELPIENFKHPKLSLVLDALQLCKLDQCERVQDAYKTIMNQNYNHYDYWLKIMSACHNYATVTGQMNEMTSAIVEWSQTDEQAYESDEDVITHWSSLTNKGSKITYQTLMKFGRLLRFQWPDEMYDKTGNATGKPMINSLDNFAYLMTYYNLEFCQDIFNGSMYAKGDQDIIKKFFLTYGEVNTYFGMVGPYNEDSLKHIAWSLAQHNGYDNCTFATVSPLFNHYIRGKVTQVNMLKLWLETPPEELTSDMQEKNTDISKSNLDYLLSCIKLNSQQNVELVRIYFDTFFFEMMMPIYNLERKYSQRSFMLVLTGPEASRKTTFFSMLFPANLRRQFVTNSTETLGGAKSTRDFATSLVVSALVVTDEFEIFYNQKNDSLFKTYVTSDVIDYVPIYEKTMRKEYKNAVLAGTTNRRSLAFEQDSNRRLAMVDVTFIDTSAMEVINWHHFYRHYIAEGKKAMTNGVHPWKLNTASIQMQYQENEEFRAQSNLELMLRELFDFDMKTHKKVVNYDNNSVQTNTELMKHSDIVGTIKQRYPEFLVKPAELRHLLKRLCGKYTSTTNNRKMLTSCKGHINSGIVMQGQYTRYVMPPRLTDFD